MGAGGKRKYIPPTVLEAAGEKRPRTLHPTEPRLSSASLSAATAAAPALAMTAARSGGSFSRGTSSQLLLGDASNLHSQLEQLDAVRRQKVSRTLACMHTSHACLQHTLPLLSLAHLSCLRLRTVTQTLCHTKACNQ